MSDITKQYEIRCISTNGNNVKMVALSPDGQTLDLEFNKISELDVRQLESLRGLGALVSVCVEGIPSKPAEEPMGKTKTCAQIERYVVSRDGGTVIVTDRLYLAKSADGTSEGRVVAKFSAKDIKDWHVKKMVAIGGVDVYVLSIDGIPDVPGVDFTSRSAAEFASYVVSEAVEYERSIPTLNLWLLLRKYSLSRADFTVTSLDRIGGRLTIKDLASVHSAIAEYFEKYPDAEPELRKEWEEK